MLKHRVLTAVVLLVVALWALFWADSMYWVGVMVFVSALAAWEWGGFVRLTNLFVRGGVFAVCCGSGLAGADVAINRCYFVIWRGIANAVCGCHCVTLSVESGARHLNGTLGEFELGNVAYSEFFLSGYCAS